MTQHCKVDRKDVWRIHCLSSTEISQSHQPVTAGMRTLEFNVCLFNTLALFLWQSCWVSVPPLGLWLGWWLSVVEEHEGPSKFSPLRWPKTWKKNHTADCFHWTFFWTANSFSEWFFGRSWKLEISIFFNRLGLQRYYKAWTAIHFYFINPRKFSRSTVRHTFLLKILKAN